MYFLTDLEAIKNLHHNFSRITNLHVQRTTAMYIIIENHNMHYINVRGQVQSLYVI